MGDDRVVEGRERLEEASEWLRSMYDLLSLKTDEKDMKHLQKRTDLFEWMIEQINRLYGGETFKGYKEMYEYSERIKNNALEQIGVTQRRNARLEQQNKRYREAIKKAKNAMSLVVGGEGSATKTAHNILREALEESE